jgi:hypothetical protein
MSTVIQPPVFLPIFSIFLAGSIEMGKAKNWQLEVTKALNDRTIAIYNPRRDDWDSSWEQKSSNTKFREQVKWELRALDLCDLIVMYLEPGTMSPISLLEFGLHARSNKLIVYCPEGFWRKGNIDITCEVYGVKMVNSLEEIYEVINEKMKTFTP